METLTSIESFVRSAETGSFSAASRMLGLTPAAVSKNVATLERQLNTRLFQRSTRRLSLTEAGESFLSEVGAGLETVQMALANASRNQGKPSGTLKVSMAFAFGQRYLLPLLPKFLAEYPSIQPDWRFENRQVDLINEGLDVAIGGGIELSPGIIARELARPHLVLVASPAFVARQQVVTSLGDLNGWPAIARRSSNSGRVQPWQLRTQGNEQEYLEPKIEIILNDPEAICQAAALNFGIALVPMPHVLPYLQEGSLVRLLPDWYADVGPLAIYFSSTKLLPAKTRVFVDFVVKHFRDENLAKHFSAF
ncbi:MAG: LysR family transcriptional regulator [Gammaproteobacteria bacterium]|nr:MAG: LysR family transcriptional regulator [Gammaproteobacteria bacterium]